MVNSENNYYLVFSSHNQAIYLYNSLIRKGYPLELVSTPCVLSSGCTQSLKFSEQYLVFIINESKLMNMNIKGIYKIIKTGNKETYQMVE